MSFLSLFKLLLANKEEIKYRNTFNNPMFFCLSCVWKCITNSWKYEQGFNHTKGINENWCVNKFSTTKSTNKVHALFNYAFFVHYIENVSSTWTNWIILMQLCIIVTFVPKLEVDYILLLRIFIAKGSWVIKTLIQGPTKCTN